MLKEYYISFLKRWILAVFFLWFVLVVTASPDYTKKLTIEGNLTIECNTTDGPDVDVYWTYGDVTDVFQNGTTLEFTNITRYDAGNYTCHRTNKTDPGHSSQVVVVVDIEVWYETEITAFSVTPTTPVSENDTFQVTCHVEGSPSPAWEIRHSVTNEVFYRSSEAGGATVNVTAACRHNGAFLCKATNFNKWFLPVTRRQNVYVYCAPDPKINEPRREVTAFIGNYDRFIEYVNCYPIPTLTWSRDDDQPMGSVNMTVSRDGSYIIGVLNFKDIQASDFGNYSLEVNNSLGSYTSVHVLKPVSFQALEAPSNLAFGDVTNTSVRLNWTSGFDMWTKMYFSVYRNTTLYGWSWITTIYPSEPYENHGIGVEWSHELTDLEGGVYTIKMSASSDKYIYLLYERSEYSNSITFNISGSPTPAPTYPTRSTTSGFVIVDTSNSNRLLSGGFIIPCVIVGIFGIGIGTFGVLWARDRIIICRKAATATPDFTTINVIEGDNQTVTCNTTESPDVEVYWTYGDSPDVVQNGTILEFIDISRNESGNYTCHVANITDTEDDDVITLVDINVFYHAEITEFSVTTNTAFENDTFEITCQVDGNPSPTWEIQHNVDWRALYSSSKAGGVTINVTAGCEYNGAFVCSGNNALNLKTRPSRKLAVHVFCAPESLNTPLVETGNIGSNYSFEEFAFGYPRPTFTWSRGANKANGTATIHREECLTYSHFDLSNIQISDYGNYSILVNNSLGSYTKTFLLKPDDWQSPQAPANLTFRELTNTSVRLSWTSGFDMWGNMSFIVMKHMRYVDYWDQFKWLYPQGSYKNHGIGQSWHYDLTDLTPGVYVLKMAAKTLTSFDNSGYTNEIAFNITGPATPAPTPWPTYDFLNNQSPWVIVAYCGMGVGVAACLLASAIALVRRYMGYNARVI